MDNYEQMVITEKQYPYKQITYTSVSREIETNCKDFKCPFRKSTFINSGRNSGCGYPTEWETRETFEPCIGEGCMAFYKGYDGFNCKMMHNNDQC